MFQHVHRLLRQILGYHFLEFYLRVVNEWLSKFAFFAVEDSTTEVVKASGSIEETEERATSREPREHSTNISIAFESNEHIAAIEDEYRVHALNVTPIDFAELDERSLEPLTANEVSYFTPVQIESEEIPCSNSTFKCKNGECLRPDQICDDFEDCMNGEDEENCGQYLLFS